MKCTALLTFMLFAAALTYGQYRYGFLKPGVKALHIGDLDYLKSNSGKLSQKTYFQIIRSDSSKFEINAICPHLHGSKSDDSNWENYRNFIDSSVVVQFDYLSQKEKRLRISNAFDYYTSILHAKPFSSSNIDFASESVYDPMREEFIKYWLKTKDSALFLKWLELLQLNGGSADEREGATVGKLFCTAPDDFYKVLNSLPKKLKENAVYRLREGIVNYINVYIAPNPDVDQIVKKYQDLVDEKLNKLLHNFAAAATYLLQPSLHKLPCYLKDA